MRRSYDGRVLWAGALALAASGMSCTAILGINGDYTEGTGGGGGKATTSTGPATTGSAHGGGGNGSSSRGGGGTGAGSAQGGAGGAASQGGGGMGGGASQGGGGMGGSTGSHGGSMAGTGGALAGTGSMMAGTGSMASAGGAMTTGSMTTGSVASAGGAMTTGSMTTGSMASAGGAMTTGSMTTGSMASAGGAMTTGSMTTGSMASAGGAMTTGSMTTGSMASAGGAMTTGSNSGGGSLGAGGAHGTGGAPAGAGGGGNICANVGQGCQLGQHCTGNGDCQSGFCSAMVCACPFNTMPVGQTCVCDAGFEDCDGMPGCETQMVAGPNVLVPSQNNAAAPVMVGVPPGFWLAWTDAAMAAGAREVFFAQLSSNGGPLPGGTSKLQGTTGANELGLGSVPGANPSFALVFNKAVIGSHLFGVSGMPNPMGAQGQMPLDLLLAGNAPWLPTQTPGMTVVSSANNVVTVSTPPAMKQAVTVSGADGASPSIAWDQMDGSFGVVWPDSSAKPNHTINFALLSSATLGVLITTQLTNTPSNKSAPRVAWEPINRTFGVVWVDDRDGNNEIYFAGVTASGSEIGTEIRLTNDQNDSRQPVIASGDGGFRVVWSDNRSGIYNLLFDRVTSLGTRSGPEYTLTSQGVGARALPTLAWTPVQKGGYGVAWMDNRNQQAQLYFNTLAACTP